MQLDRITLADGGGGLRTERLLREVIFPELGIIGTSMDDSALLDLQAAGALAITTDGFVVQPLQFPGGDIGRLAVCGTVNDLATAGARPLALTLGFIIEEGFEIAQLRQICRSIAATAAEAGVRIVSGDTKVIERQTGEGLYINTTGIGLPLRNPAPRLHRAAPGDAVLISGTIADHGAAVMAARGHYGISGNLCSDVAPLAIMAEALVKHMPVHVLKDPTRGGVAMGLHDIAQAAMVMIEIEEDQLPIAPPVQAFCDILGFDPLEVANEGKLLVILPQQFADEALAIMRANAYGANAVQIGTVANGLKAQVIMRTHIGGRRVVGIPTGEILPRIC